MKTIEVGKRALHGPTRAMKETVQLRTRAQVGEKGRVVIPAAMREALGIDVGDAVDLELKDNELRISTMRSRLRRAQERVRQVIPRGVSLADQLSAERHEAAKHE